MKHALVFATTLRMLACVTCASAAADPAIGFIDLESMDRGRVEKRFAEAAREDLSPVAAVGRPRSVEALAARLPVAAVYELRVEVSRLLSLDGSGRPRVARLRLEGEIVELAVVETVDDPAFDLHHLTAVVLGARDDYARFTVSEDGVVVGTIHASGRVARIVPAPSGSGQLMLVVSTGAEQSTLAFESVRESGRLGAIEARHVQMARIAEIQPRHVDMTRGGRLIGISGGQIGRVELQDVVRAAPSPAHGVRVDRDRLADELAAALARMSALTALHEPVSLEIGSAAIRGSDAARELFVTFNQVVDGVPVDSGASFGIDADSGAIRRFRGLLVSSEGARGSVRLSERAARLTAMRAIPADTGRAGEPVVSRSGLRYAVGVEDDLEPYWSFRIAAGPQVYDVRVDAQGTGPGEAAVRIASP